ncbi:alanine racemase [Marinagarivorans algicola]|uniref:alanine racemase n=1 Tax=Marinagarivorans algicola TaxID=1513270 RepID=UPI0006B9528D|nr:alanine racemase [Marinagarivorans algicola]
MSAQLSVTIDLNALAANWRVLSERLGTTTCGAVVKANAYGLGIAPVALKLVAQGCTVFFVAHLNEGIELRTLLKAVNDIPPPIIYVLQGCEAGCEWLFVEHNLRPVIISLPMLLRWQGSVHGDHWPCAVKVNTGMNRLGLAYQEYADSLVRHAQWWRQVPVMLMSHLACADDPCHKLNLRQQMLFEQCVTSLKHLNPSALASFANSGGIFLGSDYHFDIARPGAALYGLNPVPGQRNRMQPVVHWGLPVLQVRHASKGEYVGYGAQTQLARDSVLAVAAGGYADGILRAAFPNIIASICGITVPLMGRVSMDSLVFDVTEVDAVAEGDEITILNQQITADLQGAAYHTVGYEVLTSMGDRVCRRYKGAVNNMHTVNRAEGARNGK